MSGIKKVHSELQIFEVFGNGKNLYSDFNINLDKIIQNRNQFVMLL